MSLFYRLPPVLRRLWRDDDGVSAVEFSLLAPFMVVGMFSTVDAGMAVYDKMMLTQVLRAGAHSAIAAEDEAAVLAILQTTASDNFTVAGDTPAPGELVLNVRSYCVCPEATATEVACVTICTGGGLPNRFYDMDATIEFNGVMLPNFTLSGDMAVLAE